MLTLTVWEFDSPQGAEAGAVIVDLLARNGEVTIHDAATAAWERGHSAPRTRQLGGAGESSAVGGLFGLLLGIMFRLPLVEAAVGVPPSGLGGALAAVGVSEPFVNHVRDRIRPGTSAFFLISASNATDPVTDALDGSLFGEPLRTSLTIGDLGEPGPDDPAGSAPEGRA